MSSHTLSSKERRQLITSLCDLEIPSTIKFSPTAQQVLYSTNLAWNHRLAKQHPRATLWLAETGQANSSKQITSGQFRDHSPRWNPDGQSIAFISDRAAPGTKWGIYGMKMKNGAPEGEVYSITENEAEQLAGFEFSPDGKTIAFISTDMKTSDQRAREEAGEDLQVWGEDWSYAHLHVVDLASKSTSMLMGNVPEQHIVGFSWSSDGKRIAVVSNRTPDIEEPYKTGSKISVLTFKTLACVEICTFPNALRHVAWAADDKIYFISGTPEERVCAGKAVYAVDPIKSHKWEKSAHGEVDDAERLTIVDGKLAVQVQHGLADQIYLISSSKLLYSKQEQIEAFAVAFPQDGSPALVAVATSTINKPVEVYTISTSDDKLVQLSSHGAAFKDQHFGTCITLSTHSDDGEVELDSLFLTPSKSFDPPETPISTIVLIHGGPDARNTNCFNTYYYYWTPYLLRLGYSILLTNYRGSTGKGERFASYSTRGVGKWDYEDVITLTNNAIKLGYADPKRLVVGGLSQGGFLTYLCSTRNGSRCPWKFAAAVPLDGITDTDAMALTSDLGSTLETELNGGLAPWNMSGDDVRNRRASALWEVDTAVKKSKETGEMIIPPMLILHGEKDERCPISQAWGMRRALEAHELPYQFVTYPRQPHLFVERYFWLDLAERMGSWCEKYIGPGVEK